MDATAPGIMRARELDAVTAALVVTALGNPILASTLRTWDARERLRSCGRDSKGRRLYLLGEVIDLAKARTAHR